MTLSRCLFFKQQLLLAVACVLLLDTSLSLFGAAGRVNLSGHRPAAVENLSPAGSLPTTNTLPLAIGLPLRNQTDLENTIRDLYNPANPRFRKFLTAEEFTVKYGPTEADYRQVVRFARSHGLTIVGEHRNRVVLDVEGSVSNIQEAFQVTINTYRHPSRSKAFFAPDREPSVPTNVPVADMWGLTDYAPPVPLAHRANQVVAPLNYNGSGPSGSYQGRDFRNAYAAGVNLVGSGQTAAVVEFDGYYRSDIVTYEANCGYASVPLTNILLNVTGTPGYSGQGANAIAEVSLDIELLIAMAPGLSRLAVYEGNNPYTVFNKIATDNLAKQISCSWAFSHGPSYKWARGSGSYTLDSILSQMVAQGQSFFQASGDSDAYTGPQAVNSSTGPIPVDSIYVTSVGGTSLTMTGAGSSWSSETVWNWGGNSGSGGGVSVNYSIPSWQTSVSMAANNGSSVYRNFPDVALTAEAVQVVYNNNTTGIFGGTSCAAPLWAGFTALVNQQAAASGNSPVGFLNPALYSIASGPNYDECFHDVKTGNNIGTNTAGLYYAVAGYDLATGLGTPNGSNLINTLAPISTPYIAQQPSSQAVTNGANVTFSVSAIGQSPLSFQWLHDGSNLALGGNASGITTNTLALTSVTSADEGSYTVVVSNSLGSVTSGVAVLTVKFPPSFSAQPTSQSVVAGDSAYFSASVIGALPLAYRWRQNGTNLVDGSNLSGVSTNALMFASVSATNAGNYTLVVTNIYGSVTSSVASMVVFVPANITVGPVSQSIQCGSNASFSVTATGTAPLKYQWILDGTELPFGTNATLQLTNVHLPDHTVTVVVTNLYGAATSSVPLMVHDTLAPVIVLNGNNPFYVELGGTFADPGALAYDLCAGVVGVSATGVVNTDVIGTNTIFYLTTDGNGNTNRASRTVIVRDATAPDISWSFTNLVLSCNSSCIALMPDVTGTNYILATDLSGAPIITQNPTNNAELLLGTNLVVITVADASGNRSYSTNTVMVRDQTAPLITIEGPNPMWAELGSAFVDAGATAIDNCSGIASFQTNGLVDIAVLGTNFVTYTAVDTAGNHADAVRTVIVRDTSAPVISWSFTNLVLAADADCGAKMPDLTGTNYVLATDQSGVLFITQNPTNNAELSLGTNLVVIAIADGSGNTVYSMNQIVVVDQTPPTIVLNGADPAYLELGSVFVDPGVTVSDACSGIAAVSTDGTVNGSIIGTNLLSYTATDGSGNSNAVTRTVIVRDTIAPVIRWGFTNLVLGADSNCSAAMPDLTGTNSVVASDLSGTLIFAQIPSKDAVLALGTNIVVISVADPSGNISYSTNQIIVEDQTPPLISEQPHSRTNTVGETAIFSVAARACTPISFQWYFNNAILAGEANSALVISNLVAGGAGDYSVVVRSEGGSTISEVARLTVTVPFSFTFSSSGNPSGFKDEVDFKATVTPTSATGTVQFLTNGQPFDLKTLDAGLAATHISSMARGTNVVTAIYSGSTAFPATTNSIVQIVTNHPPAVSPAIYTVVAGSSLNIAVADLATNWSDPDDDALTIASISVSTNGITVTNATPMLFYSNVNNLNDEFVCAVIDGFGGANFQTVGIVVVPQTNAVPGISIVPGDGINLTLNGGYGSTYILEGATNFNPDSWVPLATNVLGITGNWQFSDRESTNYHQRFYRLKRVQ